MNGTQYLNLLVISGVVWPPDRDTYSYRYTERDWLYHGMRAFLFSCVLFLVYNVGLAEIWERRCGRLTEVTSDHVTYYLSDDAIMSMEHSAFKSAIHRHNFVHDLTVVYKMQVAHILGTKELSANESVTAFTLIHATPMAVLAAADRLKWKVQLRVEAVKAARRKIIAVNDHKEYVIDRVFCLCVSVSCCVCLYLIFVFCFLLYMCENRAHCFVRHGYLR